MMPKNLEGFHQLLDCAKMLPVAVALEAGPTVYDAPCPLHADADRAKAEYQRAGCSSLIDAVIGGLGALGVGNVTSVPGLR